MEYLYHYTNISSLALILKNRSIRFNSLINVDDAEEVQTSNSKFLGKYCFVSSWTDLKNESIAFWGLYTDKMSGVRIRMKKNPFISVNASLSYYNNGNKFDTFYPISLMARNDVYIYPTMPFLRKVEYTANDNLIYPSPVSYLKSNVDGTFDMQGNFNDINRFKRDCWSFQSEWRYGMMIFPHSLDGRLNLQLEANARDLPFYYYDVIISEEAFTDVEILEGPKINDGDKEIVRLLVEKYCPNAVIKESALKIN